MFPKLIWHACDMGDMGGMGDMGDMAHISQSVRPCSNRSQEHERGLEQRECMGGVAVTMQPLHGRCPSAILASSHPGIPSKNPGLGPAAQFTLCIRDNSPSRCAIR